MYTSDNRDKDHQIAPGSHQAGKQAYAPPKLTVHGEFHRLTKAKGGKGGDGAHVPSTRL